MQIKIKSPSYKVILTGSNEETKSSGSIFKRSNKVIKESTLRIRERLFSMWWPRIINTISY